MLVKNGLYLMFMLLVIEKVLSKQKHSRNYHLVVSLKKGHTIENLAKEHSLKLVRSVFPDETFYHLTLPKHPKNVSKTILSHVFKDNRVQWASRQIGRQREIRSLYFNDPFYPKQWYLHNEGQIGSPSGNDLNLIPVWEKGYKGDGVTISVLDDGLMHSHPDIAANYSPQISYDVVDLDDEDHDPQPLLTPENSHGTSCAAIIASVANNSICGVGIAHNAYIGGIRVMDGKVTDLQEAIALTYAFDKVDIYSASWGPRDDGRHISGPRILAKKAFKTGIKYGRNGKGCIYVWAVGNGELKSDNCNMDGYVSSIYTVAIAALTSEGLSAIYSEGCACILASTYVGGLHKLNTNYEKVTESSKSKVVVPGLDGSCNDRFQGTSAAAPQAAGVIALVLQANPSLTWRDVQHLIIKSAKVPNANVVGWKINGAGLHFHHHYGFGVLDATLMLSKALKWSTVPKQLNFTSESRKTSKNILCGVSVSINLNFSMKNRTEAITHLEHVTALLDIKHRHRSKLSIFLKSPFGTISQLLTNRENDNSTFGIKMWPFMSVHFWDENPQGKWSVMITDSTSDDQCLPHSVCGQINYFSLQLLGTQKYHDKTLRSYEQKPKSHLLTKKRLKMIKHRENKLSHSIKLTNEKLRF
ncbi:hypothetical protein CHUAL_010662 [Chamberlinius hualienensis]